VGKKGALLLECQEVRLEGEFEIERIAILVKAAPVHKPEVKELAKLSRLDNVGSRFEKADEGNTNITRLHAHFRTGPSKVAGDKEEIGRTRNWEPPL
jgi:hypothetical protein